MTFFHLNYIKLGTFEKLIDFPVLGRDIHLPRVKLPKETKSGHHLDLEGHFQGKTLIFFTKFSPKRSQILDFEEKSVFPPAFNAIL